MLSIPERTIEGRNFLKFRCRLDSEIGTDTHRNFSGVYYPRWRALFIDEVRIIGGKVKLFPVFDIGVQYKADGDYFFRWDFVEGAKLNFGKSPFARDEAAKTFVVTFVDDSCCSEKGAALAQAGESSYFHGDAGTAALLEKIRDAVQQRAGSTQLGLKDLGKRFRKPSPTGVRLVDVEGFTGLLTDLQVRVPPTAVDAFFRSFETCEGGAIKYDDFLAALRGPLGEGRKRLIAEAFKALDTDRDGLVSLIDLSTRYVASRQPEVLAGVLSEVQATNIFISSWDSREKNALISFAEFSDYYSGLSAVIASDSDFEAMIRSSWK